MVKIMRKWPLREFVKFNMTTGEKIKAGWHGATKVAPFLAYSSVLITITFVASLFTAALPTTAGRRKYSKEIAVYRPGDPRYERISTYSSLD